MTCIGNIGPSFFENAGFKLADFNMLSKFTMSLLMIIGRLELFTIIGVPGQSPVIVTRMVTN